MNFTWTDGPLILSVITTSAVVLRYCNRAAGDHSSIAVGAIQTELEINPVLEKNLPPYKTKYRRARRSSGYPGEKMHPPQHHNQKWSSDPVEEPQ